MRMLFLAGLVGCGTLLGAPALTPEAALQKLVEGNQRYVKEQLEHPNRSHESRVEAVAGQAPFAIVVACSDSRVAPEILFDQGIGDLFVVRVAGNVVGEIELESIRYAVTVLKSPIILVMGHENCGAVNAVLSGQGASIPEIAALIKPAVAIAKRQKGNALNNAIEANVRQVVGQLRQAAFINEMKCTGCLGVVGTYYQLQSGVVSVIAPL